MGVNILEDFEDVRRGDKQGKEKILKPIKKKR